jgi:hypothetical protein
MQQSFAYPVHDLDARYANRRGFPLTSVVSLRPSRLCGLVTLRRLQRRGKRRGSSPQGAIRKRWRLPMKRLVAQAYGLGLGFDSVPAPSPADGIGE